MGFAQTDFPRQSSILDGSKRRRTGPSVVAADGDDVGASLGYAGGDNADARARDEFDAYTSPWIYGAQIVDELRQVFNAVNIVVRRRRNKRRAGSSMPDARNVR